MRRIKIGATAALALVLFSCTSYRAYEKAKEYEMLQDWDRAILEYSKALEVDPGNLRYRMALQNARLEASRIHFERGKELRAAGHNELAAIEFELTVKLDPTNQFAAVELAKAVEAVRLRSAEASRNGIDEMKRRATEKARPPALNPASNEPISLSFPRETNVKDIYRALGNAFGINIMFDQRVKDDRITIELRDVTAQQALERVMQAAAHFYKVLDEKTLIVVPDTAQTRREYEDLVIRTFYLSNGDAEQVVNVVRTMIEARNVFPLKALNAITIRDTADKVLIAEKIIEANDKARAEVVVQVELLQMDAKKIREIGLVISGLSPIGARLVDETGAAITSLPLEAIRNLGSENWSFTIPNASYSLLKTNTEAQLLARPQLRISEGEKALLHIGQRVPVPVTTFTSTAPGQGQFFAPATSFNYQDVGIKISLEPRVHHNREVTLRLTVEVSNIAGEVTSPNGPSQPIIGTRTIESTIRLKDGETNFLAGLIRKDDSISENDTPFLADLPLIGRLFTREAKDHQTTDLVLTMTPHIIRIPDITEEDLAPMWVGTSNNLTFRGASPRIESLNSGDPFNAPTPENEQFRHQNQGLWQQEQPQEGAQETPQPPPPILEQPPSQNPGMPSDPFKDPPKDDGRSQSSLMDSNEAEAYLVNLAPRISPQPSRLDLVPGTTADWTLYGMDLQGITVPQIVLRYNTWSVDVEDVVLGEALEIDPGSPPAVSVDRKTGRISIRSSSDAPLRFRSGGEIARLRVRGGMTGESFLIIESTELSDAQGRRVEAAIAGGRVRVE